MRTLLVLFLGVVLGCVGTVMFHNPKVVGEAARSSITSVESTVVDFRRDACVREFNQETQCFQRKPARECDSLIVKKCGLPQ